MVSKTKRYIGRLWRGSSYESQPVSINPLSNRACGFPAHGLTMIFLMWRACCRTFRPSRPFTGLSGRLLLPSPSPAWVLHTWPSSIAEQWSCRAFSKGLLAIAGMPSRLPLCRHDQSRVPSLQRVLLHAFSGVGSEVARWRAGHRPPPKLYRRFSRIQLSRVTRSCEMQSKESN